MELDGLPNTIHSPEEFKKSQSKGFDGVTDFKTSTRGINRRGISPMDFDEVIEINHHFLVIETKKEGITTLSKGQKMCLSRLQTAKSFTLVFQEGKGEIPKQLIIKWPNGIVKKYSGKDKKVLVGAWADAAEKDKLPLKNQAVKCDKCGAKASVCLCEDCYWNKEWEDS
ncbi:MAG TPA: hypothetical protein VMX75_11910 [Spirochaetia bacterium]|nr:hypothetical protein [Spirochaetia bacterium]